MTIAERLAEFVRKASEEKGIKYRQIAERSGGYLTKSSVSNIAIARVPNPTVETIIGLAHGLGVDPLHVFSIAAGIEFAGEEALIAQFTAMGQRYAQLDDAHRRNVARYKNALQEEIDLQLKEQKGLIKFDRQGKPVPVGDGIEARNGTDGN